MLTSDFDYVLPSELIAQSPAHERHESRLMVVYKNTQIIHHTRFYEIDSFLSSDYLVVVNNTMVFPARLFGRKPTGGKVELLLVSPVTATRWIALVNPSTRVQVGSSIAIDGWGKTVTIHEKLGDGKCIVDFGDKSDVRDIARRFGKMPLPPYIKRDSADSAQESLDRTRYQTVFASVEGSIAAPTAGLHFSPYIIDKFSHKHIEMTDITLHVGPGTFRPVKADEVTDHKMESEHFFLNDSSAEKINAYRSSGRHILGVGTTVVRALETCARENGFLTPSHGATDLFIYPGYRFKLIKNMLTNFHLPKSTLLMLVCALAGKDLILEAYRQAVEHKYRFYSYGDAMLILDK